MNSIEADTFAIIGIIAYLFLVVPFITAAFIRTGGSNDEN